MITRRSIKASVLSRRAMLLNGVAMATLAALSPVTAADQPDTVQGSAADAIRPFHINMSLPGIDQETAQSLVEAASRLCPYSLATSGNIDAKYNVIASEAADRVRESQYA